MPAPTTTVPPAPFDVLAANPGILAAIGLDSLACDGTGIDIALIDTGVVPVEGIDADRLVIGLDATPDVLSANFRGLDTIGHGTNMASLIQAAAPASRVLSVKVGTANFSPSVATIVGAIDWTVRNAHANGLNVRVINVSFGLPSGSDGGLVAAALRRAWAAGIVVVTSAGNQGNSARSLDAPANDAKFLAVGALATEPMKVAPFSSGATGLGARRPDLIAPGVDIVGARVPGSLLDLTFPDARLGDHGFRGSGTSQATAVTSASVACLLQQRPGLNPDQVKLLLVGSAHALPWVSTNLQGRGVEQVDDGERRETAVRLRRELGQPIHGAPARVVGVPAPAGSDRPVVRRLRRRRGGLVREPLVREPLVGQPLVGRSLGMTASTTSSPIHRPTPSGRRLRSCGPRDRLAARTLDDPIAPVGERSPVLRTGAGARVRRGGDGDRASPVPTPRARAPCTRRC
ncbi:MAG: S8 family serine peptidase [Ilumatobacteraceae bacterium]